MTTADMVAAKLGVQPSLIDPSQTKTATPPVPATKRKVHPIAAAIEAPDFQVALKRACPSFMTPERLTRVALTSIRTNPALAKCTAASFAGALMQCATLGLEPGALGHAYLVPYKDQCQFILSYKGEIELARRSGQIISICAYVVHEADDFHWELGLHPDIKHVPAAVADPGPMTHVYAVANLKDGGVQFEVMSRPEVDRIRAMSRSGNSSSSPWASHYEEMAKKTVIRRLFKYLPVSVESQLAISIDEAADRGAQDMSRGFDGNTFDAEATIVENEEAE